jgi:outer membrane protein assembly factor BamB
MKLIHAWRIAKALGVLFSISGLALADYGQDTGGEYDYHHHWDKNQTQISKYNIGQLQKIWAFDANLHTPLSPIVGGSGPFLWAMNAGINGKVTLSADGILYFGDTAGGLYAIDKISGAIIWQTYVPDYSSPDMPLNSVYAQPTISGDVLYLGSDINDVFPACTPSSGPLCQENKGAIVFAVNRHTGSLLWKTKVDTHVASKIRGGITVSGSQLIVPVSSWEESFTQTGTKATLTGNLADGNLPYPCCSFRGSVVSLEKNTGAMIWKTYLAPGSNLPPGIMEAGDKGYYGNGIWMEYPIIDKKRSRIYVATGNNYSAPKKAMLCNLYLQNPAHYSAPTLPVGMTCGNLNQKIGNYVDSIVALDLKTGTVIKSFQARQYDTWVAACLDPDSGISYYPPLNASPPGSTDENCPRITDPNNPLQMLSMVGPDSGFGHLSYVPKVYLDDDLLNSKKNDDKIKMDLLIGGEKAGTLWALNADDFTVVWKKKLGPGGIFGGLQYGLATDGRYVYTNITNSANSGRSPTQPRFSHPLYEEQVNPVAPGYYLGFDFNFFGFPEAYSGSGGGLIANVDGNIIEPDNTMILTGKRDWALVNPPYDPSHPYIDGIGTYVDGTKIRTRSSFISKIDIQNGNIIWQRPVYSPGPAMQSPWMNSVLDPTGSIAYAFCTTPPILSQGMVILSCGTLENASNSGLYAIDADSGKLIALITGLPWSLSNHPIVDGNSIFVPTGVAAGNVINPVFMPLVTGLPITAGGIDLTASKLYKFQLPK